MSQNTPSKTRTDHPGGTGQLGGRQVARIGFGAMQLPRLADDRDRAVALLRRAVELGVDHIDTAQFYGNGLANGVLQQALRPEDGVTVVSKVGATPDPGGPHALRAAQKPDELRTDVEDNLRSLGLEQIPVVNLRRMDGGVGIQLSDDERVDLDDQLAALTTMRDEGLIGAIGLSNIALDDLRRALPVGIACVQNAYSLVAREDEDLLELCAAHGIAWVPFFPLGSAFPGLPKVTDEVVVQEVARSLGATPSQVGLAWLLHHDPHTLLIPGTASLEHLEANVAVGEIRLDASALAALDAVPTRPAGDLS